jgi:uncharacterized protein (DUF2236 family)
MAGVRERLGQELFQRVAGPDGAVHADRIHNRPGPRWFDQDSPIARVHGDASMFVGGIRALLLQTLHPAAMRGVAEHSGYRGDMWGRLARTSRFLAVTTFGHEDDAQQAVDIVHAIHKRVVGVMDDGTPYAANDPHLLGWVHVAEVDSFLLTHQRHGARPLDGTGCDEYLAQTATVAARLGVLDPPRDRAALRRALDRHGPSLARTPASDDVARFLLAEPPLPRAARGVYALLAAAAWTSLPGAARRMIPVPAHVRALAPIARTGGEAATRAIRWALAGDPPPERRQDT